MRRRLGLVALVVLLLAALAALLPREETASGTSRGLAADGAPPSSALGGGHEASGASSSTPSEPAAPGSAAVEPAAGATEDPAGDDRSTTLELLVVRADDEAPAAGVELVVVGKERTTARTGADGRVTLRLRPGFMTIEARAEGCRSDVATRELDAGDVGSATLELVRAGHGIRGVVVDPGRSPVAGAVVETDGARATTDARGAFALEDLTAAEHHLLVTAPGHLRLEVTRCAESPPGPPLELVLRPAVRLEGQIVARGAGPPGDWLVDVPGRQLVVRADGRFVAEPLEGGSETLVVVHSIDRQGGMWSGARRVLLEPSGTTRATFEVVGPSGLAGRVVRRGGSPLRQTVRVETLGGGNVRSFEVADDGNFELLNLPSGPARITVSPSTFPSGAPPKEVLLLPDQTTRVELLVEGAHDVAGVVVGPDGAPIEVAEVSFAREDQPRARVRSDRRGRFVVRGLPGGRWVLAAEVARERRRSPPLELLVDAGVDDVRLVVEPEAQLRCRVVDAAGRPVPGASLALVRSTGPEPERPKRSDASGRVTVTGLAPGRVELRLEGDEVLGRVARQRGVVATRCDPVAVDLVAGATAEVVVRIADQP